MAQDVQVLEDRLAALDHDPQIDLRQKIDVLNDLAWELRHSEPQRALTLSQTADELAQNQAYARGQLYSYRNLTALSTYIFPEHDRALSFANQALALLDTHPDSLVQAHVLECLAIIQINAGDYAAAQANLMQALKLSREVGDRQTESMLLNDLGNLVYYAGDIQGGLEFFQQSLNIALAEGDLEMQAIMLNNIGDALSQLGRHEEALPHLEQSLALNLQRGTRKNLANTLDSLSGVYAARHEYGRAISYLLQAYELAQEFNDQAKQAEFLRNTARVYQRRQEVDTALDFARRALNCAETAQNKSQIFICHQLLAELYEARHEPEPALAHFKQFHAVKEEVFNAQSDQKLKTLRVIHETETARQEAAIYRLKNIELQAALDKVKQLSGLLPICSSCKKIRADDGYWHEVATFIRDHSEADFTHSICPTCYEKLYPESFKKRAGQLPSPSGKLGGGQQ